MKRVILITAGLILLTGCNSILKQDGHRAHVVISSNFDINRYKTVVVLPFQNRGKSGYNEILSDEFSMELIRMGFVVVERSRLEGILKEMKLSVGDSFTREELKKVGEMLNLDCLVMGSAYYSAISSSVNVESTKGIYDIQKISLRFVDINNGEVLISASCTPVFGGSMIKEISLKIRSLVSGGINK